MPQYNLNKPDLVIHPNYHKLFMRYYGKDLIESFNVFRIEDLTVIKGSTKNTSFNEINVGGFTTTTSTTTSTFSPILLTDTGTSQLRNVCLKPKYKDCLIKASGSNPLYTSYWFDDENLPMYKIEENGPRYVVWTKNDPLTVCGTYVDRIDYFDVPQCFQRIKEWSDLYAIREHKSIIVFDLDETLIDSKCNKLKRVDEFLHYARTIYDIIVLYSHGSNLHVDDNVLKFNDPNVFDLVLSNDSQNEKTSNKNLLYLYNYFRNVRFTYATLVDDSLYNWTPEYNKFIIPYKLTTLKHGRSSLYYRI